MKNYVPILTITASDSTGSTGVQADVRTISELGGYALSAVTCVSGVDSGGKTFSYSIPDSALMAQVKGIIGSFHPKAVKVGLVRAASAVRELRNEIIGCGRIVCAPGILSSGGGRLIDDETLYETRRWLVPEATLLMLRCSEAALLLGGEIETDSQMTAAARELCGRGAQWVMLRGGHVAENRLTALLYGQGSGHFFTSYNTDGWQRHGVGGALSAAITTRLAMGDDVPEAVSKAHDYVHSRVVYAVNDEPRNGRAADIYAHFLSLIAASYRESHYVGFYAERLAITQRYLSNVTQKAVGKSPKQVIDEYLAAEARSLLANSRLTIQQIALRLGFSSQSEFSKFFSRMEQKSPSKWRFV